MESCSFRPATAPSPFPSAPSSSSSSLRTPRPNLRFPRPRNRRKIGVRRRASGFDAFPPLPGKVFVDEAIGAEYGEGFETFRMDGPLKIDVDYLNEKLQECFLQRIRHAMKPDEAFGLIFSWDNVIVSFFFGVSVTNLALEEGKDIPSAAHVQKSILHGAADHVLRKLDTPVEGLREWLDAVQTAGIPCAVASSLDRRCMVEALDRMSLSKYFKAIVTDEDDMESIANRFLSAAMKACFCSTTTTC
ncbi:hypothetical protein HU200_019559 [Digitaria exilis]|uniref:Haloacid dehalogenase-like hydrolase (HAD) superfamily protein n=1 Tax=Digitaria exilis TaxID=1010633 RepID=A0A835KF01_9POAL|nr:hypothetical protein HU200_019559 [Digitaria exilis]